MPDPSTGDFGLTKLERRIFSRLVTKIVRRYATEQEYRSQVDQYGLIYQVQTSVAMYYALVAFSVGLLGTVFRIATIHASAWPLVAAEIVAYAATACLLAMAFWRAVYGLVARSRPH